MAGYVAYRKCQRPVERPIGIRKFFTRDRKEVGGELIQTNRGYLAAIGKSVYPAELIEYEDGKR